MGQQWVEMPDVTGYIATQAKAIADLKPTFVFCDFQNQQRPLACRLGR